MLLLTHSVPPQPRRRRGCLPSCPIIRWPGAFTYTTSYIGLCP